MKINTKKLVSGKKTYPNWSTGSCYNIKAEEYEKSTLVYYLTKSNRKIKRDFPKKIILTPNFIYVLGIIMGEGPTSLGKSNYRRFTMTNSDPKVINIVLKELENCRFLKKTDLIDKSIHLLHFKEPEKKVIDYWSNKLDIDKSKFKCFHDEKKTTNFGVCHVYVSDVLLRRIIDLLQERFYR